MLRAIFHIGSAPSVQFGKVAVVFVDFLEALAEKLESTEESTLGASK